MDLLQELGITREELIDRTVGKILDLPSGFDQVSEEEYVEVSIHKEVKARVNEMIKGIVDNSKKVIQDAINDAIKKNVDDVFSKPFVRTDRWGDKIGGETTIRDLIADEAQNYWTQSVNGNGEAENGYSSSKQSRAEFYAKKVMVEFYDAQLKDYAKNLGIEIRKKIPETLADEVAKTISSYIR